MDKQSFITQLKELSLVKSATGIEYSINSVDEKCVKGVRKSTEGEFMIITDDLFNAYVNVVAKNIPDTTTALRDYIKNRTQSPALAIIKAIIKSSK